MVRACPSIFFIASTSLSEFVYGCLHKLGRLAIGPLELGVEIVAQGRQPSNRGDYLLLLLLQQVRIS